ncbi:MAG: bifunctional diaminohydroxyphosphoribosylaminopyrimidine deaminase/5-amino-6-(5-phosphoribosylamino)uracil reductase RibD, partial [Burkholderiales bacterium]
MFSISDHRFMAHALRLAERGLYTTTPNPRVGCVIVRDDAIVGEGWHERAGEPHAEVHALSEAGECARGATAYVTLEPCNHTGRTPPCTTALIRSGLTRVVAAMVDPNPRVAGVGLRALSGAGVETAVGLLENQTRELNVGFVTRMSRGRPWLRMKIAASLDGKTALNNGASQWITGEDARRDGHVLRAQSCGILTGIGTVKDDDPHLTVRAIETTRQPKKILIDSRLEVPLDARIFDGAEVLIFCASADPVRLASLADKNATVIQLPDHHGKVDLAAMAQELGRRGYNEVLIEAGTKLNGSMLRANLVDELLIYLAPHLLGDNARGMFGLPELSTLSERCELAIKEMRQIGGDLRIVARPKNSG